MANLIINHSPYTLWLVLFLCLACSTTQKTQANKLQTSPQPIIVGAAQLEVYLPLLQNKNIALVVNQTSTFGNQHLVDKLIEKQQKIKKIFAPEHGFRGLADAGEKINNATDAKTGLPLLSLYGKDKKPTASQLADIEVVIFDIQDVGARFYTYISTMHYVMEACAENNKKLIILDRPNPNGHYTDGCVLDQNYQSFVGMHPIPIVHGLTIGELAQMINGEKWLADNKTCNLTVIKCLNYNHQTPYTLPIRPSPNLPNDLSIRLYPSLCLFEGTDVSVGRGTDFPFQVLGHPDYTDKAFSFTPTSKAGASKPLYENLLCYGTDFRQGNNWQTPFSLQPLLQYYQAAKDKKKFFNDFFTKLVGNKTLQKQIEQGLSEAEIRKTWQPQLNEYNKKRKKYLLYE
jgi:uncharacterized protein YbbC (DUF1343 family)